MNASYPEAEILTHLQVYGSTLFIELPRKCSKPKAVNNLLNCRLIWKLPDGRLSLTQGGQMLVDRCLTVATASGVRLVLESELSALDAAIRYRARKFPRSS